MTAACDKLSNKSNSQREEGFNGNFAALILELHITDWNLVWKYLHSIIDLLASHLSIHIDHSRNWWFWSSSCPHCRPVQGLHYFCNDDGSKVSYDSMCFSSVKNSQKSKCLRFSNIPAFQITPRLMHFCWSNLFAMKTAEEAFNKS